MEKIYITTAIAYVNASPHLGFALEVIQTDVIARCHRLLGDKVLFLSGTDDNSLKNVQAAKKQGISVKELVDRNSGKFYELKDVLNLSFDDFIRTTEQRHVKGAQKLWLACEKDIYKKKYKGLYCVGCEEFYKEEELDNGLCPEHKTKPEIVEEENYFFRLSKYQDQLKKIFEKDEIKIIPETRKNEVLSFIGRGLEDICISRSSERAQGWGIDVPDDNTQKIWVWFDALSNYINALDYSENGNKFSEYWPADLHVIGKGILRFHAIYWPAMLLSANLPLPKEIFVHGYITVDGQKMSKSLGNVIDPFELVKKYGTDIVRYFLLREIPPTEDGDFTYQKFDARYNSDLASGLGNLFARVTTLAKKLNLESGILNSEQIPDSEFKAIIDKTQQDYHKYLKEFKFSEALKSIWELISFCDRYIESKRPWEKSDNQQLIIYNLIFALNAIAVMLKPILPETSEKMLRQLGTELIDKEWHFKIETEKILFPRI